MIGQKLGIYKLVEKLGEGGMGSVYKAYDESLDRFVAVKLLSPRLGLSEPFLARFEQEAKSVAKVRHPNLIHIYAVGSEGGYNYFAMEHLVGETLSNIIKKKGHINLNTSIKILGQVMAALNEVHHAGIVHRDIKPANIMIDKNGRVVLMDFGLAKLCFREAGERTPGITTDGELLGTPEYMSPEQAQGEKVDARSDIYSLGVVFYEMLCGTTPFHGKSAIAVLRQHVESEPPPLKAKLSDPDVLGQAEFVIKRSMAKSPDDRYQDLGEMAIDLSGICRTSSLVLLSRGAKRDEKTVALAESSAGSAATAQEGIQYERAPQSSPLPPQALERANGKSSFRRKAMYVAAACLISVLSLCALGLLRSRRQSSNESHASPSKPSALKIAPQIRIVPQDGVGETIEGRLDRIKVNADGTLEFSFDGGKGVSVKGADIKEIINLSAANGEG